MNTDKLIRGNAYLWCDEDGTVRTLLYDRIVRLPNDVISYRFKMKDKCMVHLSPDAVRREVFFSPSDNKNRIA